jgi:hypothetical protein
MRALFLASAALVLLLAAPESRAGPTCQDHSGETIRCGTPGAMPVGWTAPAGQATASAGPTPAQVVGLVGAIGGLFALLALLPNFDGSRPGAWDRQEGDAEG